MTKLQTDSTHTYTNSGTFAYDAANNLKPSSGWTYNQNNQLTAAPASQGLAGATGLSYDASGSLQTINGMTLSYDCWGHMTSVANTASGTVRFAYDSSGRRISKTVGTVTTFYVWDGSTLVSVLDSSGNPVRDYTFGIAGVVSDHTSTGGTSSDQLYATDPQGKTTDMCDGASGVWRRPPFIASPFGTIFGTPPADPFMLFGDYSYLLDSELRSQAGGQTFYEGMSNGGRPYVPGMGSFGTPSAPGGFGGGGSPYGFDGGNPVGDDEDNTDYTSERQLYALGLQPVSNGLMSIMLVAADGNPIEATRQFITGRGALGNKLSPFQRTMAGFTAATAGAGRLGRSAEELAEARRVGRMLKEAAEAARVLKPDEEAAAIRTIDNAIANNARLGPLGEVEGTIKDLLGRPVPHRNKPGEFYKHTQELQEAMDGLKDNAELLKRANTAAGRAARQRALDHLEKVWEALGRGLYPE